MANEASRDPDKAETSEEARTAEQISESPEELDAEHQDREHPSDPPADPREP
jgi:hypothetical protein